MMFDYRTEEFLVQFDSCYFAPSRWRLFPSCKLYWMARNAMLLLWNAYEIELWLDDHCYDDRFDIMIDGEWYASYPPVRQDEWSYHYKISWLMHPGTDCGSITLRYPGHQLVRL